MLKSILTLTGIYLSFFSFSQNGYNIIFATSDGASFRTSGLNEYYENPTKTTVRNLGASLRVGLPMKYGKYEIISGIDVKQKGFLSNSYQENGNTYNEEVIFYNLETLPSDKNKFSIKKYVYELELAIISCS